MARWGAIFPSKPSASSSQVFNCSGTGDLQAAIDSLHPGGGTIEVLGNCENPKVDGSYVPFVVSGFTGPLTIETGTLSATLFQPMIGCGTDTSNVNPTPSAVLRIEDSLDVRLIGSTVETLEIAGGLGVVLDNSQLSFEGDVHVRDSRTSGVRVGGVTGSGLRLTGTGNEIIDNCRFGVRVARGSLGDFRGNALIGRNRRFGLSAFESGRLNLTEQAVVENNHIGGLLGRFGAFITVFGEATIRGNGGMANPNDFFFRFTSGIIADFGSTLLIRGSNPNVGVMIVDNDVPALLLDNNSTAELENVTATGNNDGMIIEHQSVVQFLANVKLENNGQNDLDCDQSSLFHGDLTGVKNDRCSRTPKSK